MEKIQIYIPEWLAISKETRAKLVEMFGLSRDIATEVSNNQVLCDGHSNQMLGNINLVTLTEKGFTGDTFLEAFNKLITSLEAPEVEAVVEPVSEVTEPIEVVEPVVEPVIEHQVTAEEIKDNNLEEVLTPGDTIGIPVVETVEPVEAKQEAKKSNKK